MLIPIGKFNVAMTSGIECGRGRDVIARSVTTYARVVTDVKIMMLSLQACHFVIIASLVVNLSFIYRLHLLNKMNSIGAICIVLVLVCDFCVLVVQYM